MDNQNIIIVVLEINSQRSQLSLTVYHTLNQQYTVWRETLEGGNIGGFGE